MADNYTITGSADVPQVTSTGSFPATRVNFITHPHSVQGQATLPREQVAAIGFNTVVEPLAFNIERLLTDGTVTAVSFTESLDESGLLAEFYDFTVSVPSADTFSGGTLTAIVRLSLRQLYLISDNIDLFAQAKQRLEDMRDL
jgi:hypothetical protein